MGEIPEGAGKTVGGNYPIKGGDINMCEPFPCSGSKMGIAMTEEVFLAMPPEERTFWTQFLLAAVKEIGAGRKGGEHSGEPSEELRQMYRRAVGEYSGEKYCLIHQLRGIFLF